MGTTGWLVVAAVVVALIAVAFGLRRSRRRADAAAERVAADLDADRPAAPSPMYPPPSTAGDDHGFRRRAALTRAAERDAELRTPQEAPRGRLRPVAPVEPDDADIAEFDPPGTFGSLRYDPDAEIVDDPPRPHDPPPEERFGGAHRADPPPHHQRPEDSWTITGNRWVDGPNQMMPPSPAPAAEGVVHHAPVHHDPSPPAGPAYDPPGPTSSPDPPA
jgi:hypothetical protein